jgi:ribonuclease R
LGAGRASPRHIGEHRHHAEIDAHVLAETARLCAAGIGDGVGRDDLSPLPFVTIDGPHSRDLDQALYIERDGNGYCVHYALADAAYFVHAGSTVFAHALARGTSYYLPGLAFPMLPRQLSEGLISLGPGVRRNALIVSTRLSPKGAVIDSRIAEGIIRSRRQLTFGEVEEYLQGTSNALAGTEFEASLKLLRVVGELLATQVEARGKIAFNRQESELTWQNDRLIAVPGVRRDSERYNEQLSLLANSEGGRLLFEGAAPWVHPIYRVHPAPTTERLVGFQRLTETLAKRSACPTFNADDGAAALSGFLRNIAQSNLAPDLLAAVERQCLLLNERSFFSTEPKAHFGVAATPYARLSAPMREIVGIFLHKELRDLASGQSRPTDVDGDIALRELVLEAGNRAKDLQSRLEGLAMETAIQGTFPTLGATYTGTIVGFSSSKLYVSLHAQQVDVRVSYFDLARAWGGGWLAPAPHGADLVRSDNGAVMASLGDSLELLVAKRPNGLHGLIPTARRAIRSGAS